MTLKEYTTMNCGMFCLLTLRGCLPQANDNKPIRKAGLFDLAAHLVRAEYAHITDGGDAA